MNLTNRHVGEVVGSSSQDILQVELAQRDPGFFAGHHPLICLSLQELCKRSILKKLRLTKMFLLEKLQLPRILKSFLKKISFEYFIKAEHKQWLRYLNCFAGRDIDVAKCLLDQKIYTIKLVSSSAPRTSSLSVAGWKRIRHANVMRYVTSIGDKSPCPLYRVFEGTKMSLRMCQKLKICRNLMIPEPLLWNLIDQILTGLLAIHYQEGLIYDHFGLDHVYYAWDEVGHGYGHGERIILENPLLRDLPRSRSHVDVSDRSSQNAVILLLTS
jgi:hypothetical protein